MTGSLDIGTLSGRIELDDNISSTMNLILNKVDALEERFGGMGKTVAASAAGFFTAEVAIKAVEKALDVVTGVIKDFTMEGAEIADVEESFKTLNEQAGRVGETLMGTLRDGTHNTITDFELMKTVNADLAAGMNLTDDQFRTLADGAFALAQATGKSVKEAFDTMNEAMLTGRTRSLQVLTGKIDLTAAEEAYATSLNTTSDKLSEEGKLEAARIAILDSVTAATKRLGVQTDGLDEMLAQARTQWDNFYEGLQVSVATSPHVIHAFEAIRDAVVKALGGDTANIADTFMHYIDKIADAVATYGPVVIDWFVTVKDWVLDVYDTVTSTWAALPDWLKNVAVNSALALGGIVLLDGAVSMATSGVTDMIGTWGNLTTALVGLPTLLGGVSAALGTISVWLKTLSFASFADGVASMQLMGGAAAAAIGPLGAVAIAVGAIFAAFEIGKMEKVSDWFFELGLEVQGYSQAEQDAMIATEKATRAQAAQAETAKGQSDAAAKVKAMMEQLVEAQNANNHSTEQGVNIGREHKMVLSQTADEAKKLREAQAELASSGKDFHETLKGINTEVLQTVKGYLDAGVAANTLATVYGLTNTQLNAVVALLKEEKEALKLNEKQVADSAARWAEYYQTQAEMSGDVTDKIVADIERWKAETIKAHKQAKTDTADFYDWVEKSEKQMYEKADRARLEADQHSKAYFDKIARDAQAAYEFALKHADQFTAGYIKDLGKTADAARNTAANWTAALGGSMDEVTKKVRTLSGEMISVEEASKRMSSGGSFEINRANLAANAKTWGIPEDAAFAMAKRGFSFQEMIAAWKAGMVASWVPHGPKIPGFRDGGVGDFGEGTLAVLHGREAIVPLDGHAGGLGGVKNTFYVNGTAEESARKIGQILMRDLKSNRQFSNV